MAMNEITTDYELDTEFLQKVWSCWRENNIKARPISLRSTYSRFNSLPRSNRFVRQFEDWLWLQGGEVKQRDRRRYIRFFDEDRLLLFILKNS